MKNTIIDTEKVLKLSTEEDNYEYLNDLLDSYKKWKKVLADFTFELSDIELSITMIENVLI